MTNEQIIEQIKSGYSVTDNMQMLYEKNLPLIKKIIKPYSVYDISVYADGFFRERSVDVPVFAGITSIQQFNMVPLPLYMTENDETITYYNQEPELQ